MQHAFMNMVELKVPVNGDYVSVVRLLVSGLATRLGLPVDELENLKLVIGEAFLNVVEKVNAGGLVTLKWREDSDHITVSIGHPALSEKEIIKSAGLSLLSQLGGSYDTSIVDGVEHLDLDFEIKHRDNRPFIFNGPKDGQA